MGHGACMHVTCVCVCVCVCVRATGCEWSGYSSGKQLFDLLLSPSNSYHFQQFLYAANADIPSDPPFAGWVHIFHDRPAYPLTVLKIQHYKITH